MFPFFPYTNFHELNADWVLKTVKQIADAVSQFADNLAHVVRVTAQNFTVDEQRIACGNIRAVSYHTQSTSAADRTVARANLQAVGYEAQNLTDAQKTAARDNIGAISENDLPDISDVVRYSAQVSTDAQKQTARENIGAASQTDMSAAEANIQRAVRWDAQTLSDAQKAQARSNIGASQVGTIPAGVVRYDAEQTLTEVQKAQARENIGANSGSAPDDYVFIVSENEQGTGYEVTGNLSDAAQVTGRVFIVLEQSGRTRESLAELSFTGATLTAASAFFADFFDVTSSIPNTITQVIIDNNGATVTEIQQRQVPQPAPLGADAGKVLTATRSGAEWQDKEPLVVTFSGTTVDGDAACDKTWTQIAAAIADGKELSLRYDDGVNTYQLLYAKMTDRINGYLTYINNPTSPHEYTSIGCSITNANHLIIAIVHD